MGKYGGEACPLSPGLDPSGAASRPNHGSRQDQGPILSAEMQEVITRAISQGKAKGLQRRDRSTARAAPSRPRKEGTGSRRMRHPSMESSVVSEDSAWEEQEQEFSPDAPAFSGLFKSNLFKSILHKTKIITQLGSKTQADQGSSDPVAPTPRDSIFKVQALAEELVLVPSLPNLAPWLHPVEWIRDSTLWSLTLRTF